MSKMVSYHKKISFLKIRETWFDGRLSLLDLFTFKVVYHQKTARKMIGVKQIRYTLELDLEQDKQAILAGMTKAYRQQIRKAEEEGVTVETSNDIDTFIDFFNVFAVKKGTYATSKERMSEKKDFLELSFARHNNNIVAAHSYLIDREQKIVRHYQTANKRFDDNVNKNFVGQANKYLLVTNIMRYKDEGYKIFDFGGYATNTTDESLLGINNYKEKFGGRLVECRHFYSVPYWLLKRVGKAFGWMGNV